MTETVESRARARPHPPPLAGGTPGVRTSRGPPPGFVRGYPTPARKLPRTHGFRRISPTPDKSMQGVGSGNSD